MYNATIIKAVSDIDNSSITRVTRRVARMLGRAALVLMVAMTTALTGYEISYQSGQPAAQERGLATATFNLIRDNSAGSLAVDVEVLSASTAFPADYEWEWLNSSGVWVPVGAVDAVTGTVSFANTQASISMRIRPIQDSIVERREELSLGIVIPTVDPPPYSRGAQGTVTVTIADDDHKAHISVIRATADEDISLRGNDPDDTMSLRRGIVRVIFDNFDNNGALQIPPGDPYYDRVDFPRNLSVDILDAVIKKLANATKTADYVIKYKISGHNNPSTATGTFSQVGLATNISSGRSSTTGLNFRLMAALANESTVPLKEQDSADLTPNSIPAGTTFYFESDPAETVHTSSGTAISAINFTPVLVRPVPSGTKVKIIALGSGATEAPDDVVVERTYGPGATVLRLGGGSGGLYEGDVISVEGDEKPYVIVNDPVLATELGGRTSARVTIFAYEGGVDGGLAKAQTTAAAVTTMLTPKFFGADQNNMQIGVPSNSTRVEFSIEPVGFGDGVELAEYVLLNMTADDDYIIQGSSEALVTVADRDLVAGVRMKTSAGLPNIPGSFEFTLTEAHDEPVEVEFDLYAKTLDVNGLPTATDAEGVTFQTISRSIVFGRNSTTANLSIVPIIGTSVPPATITITLRGSDDYKRGGGTSGVNPSATMIVNNVVGTVTITAPDGTALEGGVNNGQFQVSLAPLITRTTPLPIRLQVGGTAVAGRFEFFDPSNPSQGYPVVSGYAQGISIPATANSVLIGVRAIENESADPDSQVQLTLNSAGTNYVTGTPSSAVVSILDNEPVVGVRAGTDAVLPSTAGRFIFSYPGSAVTQQVTVRYSFSGATRGTDFDSETTVTIAGSSPTRSAELLITPRATTTATSVTVTLTSNSAYKLDPTALSATIRFVPEAENDASANKPTPGTVGTSSSGGGCGLGSGMSALIGLLLLAWIGLRRREH